MNEKIKDIQKNNNKVTNINFPKFFSASENRK